MYSRVLPVLAAGVRLGGGAWLANRAWGADCLTVLAYHRIGYVAEARRYSYATNISAAPDMFERQLDYIARHFNVIDLAALHRWLVDDGPLPPRPLLISFDDGYRDNYEYAYPLLRRYGLPATIFLITAQIENPALPWWDECAYYFAHTQQDQVYLPPGGHYPLRTDRARALALDRLIERLKSLPEAARRQQIQAARTALAVEEAPANRDLFMTWDQVRRLVADGVACQPHTLTHPILAQLNEADMYHEIEASRRCIEKQTRQAVVAFAYPNGRPTDYNATTLDILKRTGYRLAFTMQRGPVRLGAVRQSPLQISRIFMGYWDTFDLFMVKVNGLLGLLP